MVAFDTSVAVGSTWEESKNEWLTFVVDLVVAYVTATQLVLVTWLLLHDCFPNVTSISFSHVTMEWGQTSAIDLATSLVTMLEHMGKGQLDSIVLRGSRIPWTDPAYAILVDHLYFHPLTNLKHLDLADSPLPHVTWVRMTPSFVRDHFAHLTSFDVQSENQIIDISFLPILYTALTSASFPALLHVLAHVPHLMHLNISRNELAIGAWKALAAHMLLDPAVSVFHTLRSFDCSATALTSECIQMLSAGFTGRLFYHTSKKIHHDMPGQSLSYLNLTGAFAHNLLDTYSIHRLSETLRRSQCVRLHTLNVARNYKLEFQTLYHFNEVGGSFCLPLAQLLLLDGAVGGVSVAPATQRDCMRDAKRLAFTKQSELDAIATDLRTKMKCAIRRELYDRLEADAASANLRVHPVKHTTKTKLAIHRKIQQEILDTVGR
ncbi:hypothetical protein DYB26_009667 [Aphanomyces astaci]|uniref:Uncharacterized protein n=1 Tax=Aphanomyces astaci TaxID=112090 RepID=A0A3R7C3E1_APHAT|nr:hypothetical protein DYB26_009667 [Aphanomyces astaci]